MSSAKTASPLESAVNSLAWIHHIAGEQSPTDHPLVKAVLAGAQRLLAHQKSKREPIAVIQLEQLVTCEAGPSALRYTTLDLLLFVCLPLRLSFVLTSLPDLLDLILK